MFLEEKHQSLFLGVELGITTKNVLYDAHVLYETLI